MVKNLPAKSGDTGLIPARGRFHVPQSNLSLCSRAQETALVAQMIKNPPAM